MHPQLVAVAEAQGGTFSRAQALRCGMSDDEIRYLLSCGAWLRIRRGTYAGRDRVDGLDVVGRNRLHTHAVMVSLAGRTVLSHVSAVAMHGIPLWGIDLARVHVTRLDNGAPRVEGDVHHHVGRIDDDEIVWISGVPVMCLERALVEMACRSSFESAVVAMDAALHAGSVTPDQLLMTWESMATWPGSGGAGRAIAFADGLSESPGESRGRVLFLRTGLPAPVLQREIHDSGGFIGRVDYLFEGDRTIGEFDGRVKYGPDGDEAARTVFAEKRREDRLRAAGYEVVRMAWTDLERPAAVANRFRQAFRRARGHRRRAGG